MSRFKRGGFGTEETEEALSGCCQRCYHDCLAVFCNLCSCNGWEVVVREYIVYLGEKLDVLRGKGYIL